MIKFKCSSLTPMELEQKQKTRSTKSVIIFFFKFVLNSERFQLKKGIAKLDGVSNVEVTTSGRPSIGSGF